MKKGSLVSLMIVTGAAGVARAGLFDGWTALPHEIESWDTAGVSYVWVRADVIASRIKGKHHD